eukprot:jgi/Mesen1/6906/ME000354S06098
MTAKVPGVLEAVQEWLRATAPPCIPNSVSEQGSLIVKTWVMDEEISQHIALTATALAHSSWNYHHKKLSQEERSAGEDASAGGGCPPDCNFCHSAKPRPKEACPQLLRNSSRNRSRRGPDGLFANFLGASVASSQLPSTPTPPSDAKREEVLLARGVLSGGSGNSMMKAFKRSVTDTKMYLQAPDVAPADGKKEKQEGGGGPRLTKSSSGKMEREPCLTKSRSARVQSSNELLAVAAAANEAVPAEKLPLVKFMPKHWRSNSWLGGTQSGSPHAASASPGRGSSPEGVPERSASMPESGHHPQPKQKARADAHSGPSKSLGTSSRPAEIPKSRSDMDQKKLLLKFASKWSRKVLLSSLGACGSPSVLEHTRRLEGDAPLPPTPADRSAAGSYDEMAMAAIFGGDTCRLSMTSAESSRVSISSSNNSSTAGSPSVPPSVPVPRPVSKLHRESNRSNTKACAAEESRVNVQAVEQEWVVHYTAPQVPVADVSTAPRKEEEEEEGPGCHSPAPDEPTESTRCVEGFTLDVAPTLAENEMACMEDVAAAGGADHRHVHPSEDTCSSKQAGAGALSAEPEDPLSASAPGVNVPDDDDDDSSPTGDATAFRSLDDDGQGSSEPKDNREIPVVAALHTRDSAATAACEASMEASPSSSGPDAEAEVRPSQMQTAQVLSTEESRSDGVASVPEASPVVELAPRKMEVEKIEAIDAAVEDAIPVAQMATEVLLEKQAAGLAKAPEQAEEEQLAAAGDDDIPVAVPLDENALVALVRLWASAPTTENLMTVVKQRECAQLAASTREEQLPLAADVGSDDEPKRAPLLRQKSVMIPSSKNDLDEFEAICREKVGRRVSFNSSVQVIYFHRYNFELPVQTDVALTPASTARHSTPAAVKHCGHADLHEVVASEVIA